MFDYTRFILQSLFQSFKLSVGNIYHYVIIKAVRFSRGQYSLELVANYEV